MVKRIKRKLCWVIATLYNKVNLKKIQIGTNTVINGVLFIEGTKNVKIGNDVRINSGEFYNMIGGDTRTILKTVGEGQISIGNNCGISNSCFVSSNDIILENDVTVGGGCKFYDTDFHPLEPEARQKKDVTKIKSKPIRVCKGAFIGAHCIILKGVTIGENSIVGAGSVVTKDVPNNQIWAGNPIKFIREV